MNAFDYFIQKHDKAVASRPSMISEFKRVLADNNIHYKRCYVSKDAYDSYKDEYKMIFSNGKDAENCINLFNDLSISFFGLVDGNGGTLIVRHSALRKYFRG